MGGTLQIDPNIDPNSDHMILTWYPPRIKQPFGIYGKPGLTLQKNQPMQVSDDCVQSDTMNMPT